MEWPVTLETKSLTVDIHAVVSVLRELTIAAWKRCGGEPLKAFLHADDETVAVELREPASERPLSNELVEESTRLIQKHGGRLEHQQNSETKEWRTTLTFSLQPTQPQNEPV